MSHISCCEMRGMRKEAHTLGNGPLLGRGKMELAHKA